MKIKLPELQDDNKEVKKLKAEKLLKSQKDIEEMFYYQGFPYVPKIICFELISKYYNNPLTNNFRIEKI